MRNTIVICAFFILFAFANAETLGKARLRGISAIEKDIKSESAFLSLKETPFGKNLFSMMSLKFQATGRLDTINNLLTELSQNIQAQQEQEDQEYRTQSEAYNTIIADKTNVINEATANIKSWSEEQAFKEDTVRQKRLQRESLEEEKAAITEFLAQLKITREQEVEAFQTRIQDQNAMIEGLDEVIAIFSLEVQNNENLDKDAATNILNLLQEIRESLVASVREDTNSEVAAAAKYTEFVAQQEERLRQIEAELQTLRVEITNLDNEIEALKSAISREIVRRQDAIQVKADTEEALRILTEKYNANVAVRKEQQTLIQQVRARLNSNPDNVQQFLNNA